MNRELRTCLACGREAPDVAMRLVEHADPIPVTVMVPVSNRRNAVEVPRVVAGRWTAEWRCRNTGECAERLRAQLAPEPMPSPEPAAADEEVPV